MVNCFIPIYPHSTNSKFFEKNFDKAVSQIIEIQDLLYDGQNFIIKIQNENPDILAENAWAEKEGSSLPFSDYFWLKIEFEILENQKNLDSYFEKLKFREFQDERWEDIKGFWYNYFVLEILREGIRPLLFSANIAFPGLINTYKWIYSKTKEIIFLRPFGQNLDFVNLFVECNNLQPFQTLSIKETYNWIFKNKIFNKELPNTKVSKALNAFSHLFFDYNPTSRNSEIMWSMLGLEALFGERYNIQKALQRRIPLFIGMDLDEKTIKNLYSARSDFIHGRAPLSNIWSQWLVPLKLGKQTSSLDNVISLGNYVFLRSIQKLCLEKATNLEFLETTNFKIIKDLEI